MVGDVPPKANPHREDHHSLSLSGTSSHTLQYEPSWVKQR